mgnify:CR=1 FL=1
MPTKPKVSVVLITYNQQDYVGKTIESVLNQSYQNFEIIIADDSSTDETAKVIKSYKDKRIKYVKTDYNIGINGNLNLAVSKASCDIVALISGDDKWRKNYLERIVECFEKMSDIDVLHPMLCAIDKDDKYIKGQNKYFYYIPNRTKEENLYIAFMDSNILQSPGMAMRKKVVETIFPLSYSFVNMQDYVMHIDILANGFKSYVLDDILVDYRVFNDGTNISLNNSTAHRREEAEIALLMDYFLKIKDIKLLKRVFKNEIQSTNLEPFDDTIPFFLGQMALRSLHYHRQEWGYHTIMKFLSDKKNFDIVYKRYGFAFKNYLNLVKNLPSLESVKIKEKYVRKYKKYRIFFKIAIIIIFVEILFMIWLFY